jgi:hypothetical protein
MSIAGFLFEKYMGARSTSREHQLVDMESKRTVVLQPVLLILG